MNGFMWLIVPLVLTITAVVLHQKSLWPSIERATASNTELLIGILSSRSNFEHRNAIRESWLTDSMFSNRDKIRAMFVLGNDSCSIPPEDRKNRDVCSLWNVSIPEDKHQTTCLIMSSTNASNRLTSGFSFKVGYPIIIEKLGILKSALIGAETGEVKLINQITEEVVVKISFSISNSNEIIGGYVYFPVEPFIYPKDFEGIVETEIDNLEKIITAETQKWNSGEEIISFVEDTHDVTRLSASSFMFSIHEIDVLKSHINSRRSRLETWNTLLEKESQIIDRENRVHRDLLIVNVLDVYRNLPLKLLHFFKRVSNEFNAQFVLKTDDDVALDVASIYRELQKIKSKHKVKIWWSRFRFNWAVDRVGKWAEFNYKSIVYPPFACGLGSILSADLTHWLANNVHTLFSYQGEDVSLGIWLAAIGPNFIHDFRWQCGDECNNKDTFNIGQLTPLKIKEAWESLKKCSNLCGCA